MKMKEKPKFNCERCYDTGEVFIPEDMDGAPRSYRCNCTLFCECCEEEVTQENLDAGKKLLVELEERDIEHFEGVIASLDIEGIEKNWKTTNICNQCVNLIL